MWHFPTQFWGSDDELLLHMTTSFINTRSPLQEGDKNTDFKPTQYARGNYSASNAVLIVFLLSAWDPSTVNVMAQSRNSCLVQTVSVGSGNICSLCCFSTRATGITTWSVRFRSHSSADRMSIKWVIWNSGIPDFTNFAHHSRNPCLGSYFSL